MDPPEAPDSPEWRPASSLSGGVPSPAASSLHYVPPSFRSALHLTSSTVSETSSLAPDPGSHMTGAVGLDVAPFEPAACERLTEELRSFMKHSDATDQSTHASSTSASRSMDAAIHQAATTIRYHAKWFEPAALATLIQAMVQAVLVSSSSADLYAALLLVDTVSTYSVLPGSVLPDVARFIAYAYYQGTRANRLKKLVTYTWEVASHILQSHLGEQFIGALLDILRDDLDAFDAKMGFAYTTGAFMLISENLLSRADELPTVKLTSLLVSLDNPALSGNGVIREHIIDLLSDVLADDDKIRDLDESCAWDTLLNIAERCVSPAPHTAAAQSILESLQRCLTHFEPRHRPRIAQLLVEANRPLTPLLHQELLAQWQQTFRHVEWSDEYERALTKLCASSFYLIEVMNVARKSLELSMRSDDSVALKKVLQKYQRLMTAPSTAAPAASVIGKELVRAFRYCMQGEIPYWRRVLLFNTLCDLSNHSADAADLLLRLRADVKGTIYIMTLPTVQSPPNSANIAMGSYILHDAWQLPIEHWLDVLLTIMQDGAQTWEAYDMFLTELPALLSNHRMFYGRVGIIKQLLKTVCGHLEAGTYQKPPVRTGLTRSYVVMHLVWILTIMISYHRHLDKAELLRVVSIFKDTAGSGDHAVSKHCIHALTVCCAEIPVTMSSYMYDIIDKMSKMVTQRFLAIHVLHFLAGLSRLPHLHRNFTQHDYKKVFAVCFSFLQSTRGAKTTLERKQTPTSESSSIIHSEEALPEYVYALAHHLISFWYLSLRRHDREPLKQYIANSLTYTDADGNEVIEDQGLVTIDLMDRVDSDNDYARWRRSAQVQNAIEPFGRSEDPFTAADGQLVERHRLLGLLLITTKTSLRTGRTLVNVRRPSGNSQRVVEGGQRARITMDCGDDDYIPITPNDPLGTTYGTITIPSPSSALGSEILVNLAEDNSVHRAIQSFDRTSALDSHKTGVIYIADRQTTEDEILCNHSGSPDYREFIHGLGTLERLQGATFNTQGLDHVDNVDGMHTIVWHNRVTEVVFHITTLMPNSADLRENTAKKKRHIGNDHVNIVFDNSGERHDFTSLYNIFPGQFTHVYIVITPSARMNFLEARTEAANKDKKDRFYSVRVVTRPDYPNVSPAAERKVVSGASLPGFVRNLALNECLISLMWTWRNESLEYPSSWRSRLHQLRRLADRYG